MRYAFLAWILFVLPLLAWRSAQSMRAAREGGDPLPPRTQIYTGTLILLAGLFVLAWLTARAEGIALFHTPPLGIRALAAGGLALLGSFGLRALSRTLHTPEQRRRLPVQALMPRNRIEWMLYVAMCVAAGIAEEAAYRGVGMEVLRSQLGAGPAVLILATAFALGHLTQEWKSVGVVFLMALMMHALVDYTGTLVVAMAVHAGYDVAAGALETVNGQRSTVNGTSSANR